MKNLAKVLMMAMVVLAGASTASAKTTTSVETVSVGEAAQKFYAAEQKAANTGKNVTKTVYVKCTKKAQETKYLTVSGKFAAKFFEGVTNTGFIEQQNRGTFTLSSDDVTTDKGKAKTTFSDGVLAIKVTFSGKRSKITNKMLKYAKLNLAEFESRIVEEQPQTQREIAWFCAKFVSEHAKMNTAYSKTNTEEGFYNKKAGGDCGKCARWISTYMGYAGVKHYGNVVSKKLLAFIGRETLPSDNTVEKTVLFFRNT
jgi:hypothetical protein